MSEFVILRESNPLMPKKNLTSQPINSKLGDNDDTC
jgi:hypothetical protein